MVTGPSAPPTVNLTTDGSDWIEVSWSRPAIYFSQIDLYRVRYWYNESSDDKHTMVLPVAHMETDRHQVTRFNKIAIQGTPQMTVDKEAIGFRESTHIVILCVPCSYTKCNPP